jgi:hypothetical protein
VANDRTAHLNVDLAERTRLQADKPARATITFSPRALTQLTIDPAAEYAAAESALTGKLRDDRGNGVGGGAVSLGPSARIG